MAYKNIRVLSLLIFGIGAVLVLLGSLEIIGLVAPSDGMSGSPRVLLGLAFVVVGRLGTSVGRILEAQSDQIADLQRQLGHQRVAS